MGVYIDMEMPQEGFVEILVRSDGTVQQTGQSYRIGGTDYYTPYVGEMPTIYKAISVPPHGNLIDRDVLSQMFDPDESFGAAVLEIVADTPTIIPAEPFNNLSKPRKDDEDIPICTKASPASLGIYKKAEEGE